MRDHRAAQDRGSGTVLAIGLIAAVMAVAVALASVIQLTMAGATAQSSADLAALAAASAARDQRALGVLGDTGACDEAARVAAAGDALITTCDVATDGSVTVKVYAERGPFEATRAARAGTG